MLCTSLIQAGLSVFLTLFGLFYFSPKNITLLPGNFYFRLLPPFSCSSLRRLSFSYTKVPTAAAPKTAANTPPRAASLSKVLTPSLSMVTTSVSGALSAPPASPGPLAAKAAGVLPAFGLAVGLGVFAAFGVAVGFGVFVAFGVASGSAVFSAFGTAVGFGVGLGFGVAVGFGVGAIYSPL